MNPEIKNQIVIQCGTLDGNPFVEILESMLISDDISVEKGLIKVKIANITDLDLLNEKLKELSEKSLGTRMFLLSVQDDSVTIIFNKFRPTEKSDSDPADLSDHIIPGSSNSLFSMQFSYGLGIILAKLDAEMIENFSAKQSINILSVGCGDPSSELNSIYRFFTKSLRGTRFSYTGVDVCQSKLAKSKYKDRVGNIQVTLLCMDACNVELLEQSCGKADLIIMNHPEVLHGSKFASTFINYGVPRLLADDGSLIIVNYDEVETKHLLNGRLHDFSSFGSSVNFGRLCTIDESSGLYETGLHFGSYKTMKKAITLENVSTNIVAGADSKSDNNELRFSK